MYIQPLLQYFIGLYNVKEPRRCKLLKSVYEGQGSSVVAIGQVHPLIPDATSHFEVIMEGCMWVQVDYVMNGFGGLPLPLPQNTRRCPREFYTLAQILDYIGGGKFFFNSMD